MPTSRMRRSMCQLWDGQLGSPLCMSPTVKCKVRSTAQRAPRKDDPLATMLDVVVRVQRAAALHGMWSDCVMGTQPSCKELAPYRPPQPSEEPHRYIFLLYEQTGSVDAATAGTAEWQNWDAEGFLAANPSLEPAAINFFYSV
eukprot:jgi/Tetstr1/444189/TSEL_032083.t1